MRITPKQLLIAGTAMVGAAAMWSSMANMSLRQRRLARGEIRPIGHLRNRVGEWCIYSRVALPPRPSGTPPVVLIHGLGVSGAYFVPTLERLGVRFSVYAPDLPGHGKSSTPRRPLDIHQLTDALVAWMDAVPIESACLVGNSMGSQIAVDAALRHPSRVNRLVLIGPTTDPRGRTLAQLLKRLLRDGLHERPSLSWILAKDYGHMGRRLPAEFRFMRWDPIEVKLPDVEVPTMLVRGEKDPISPQRWLEEAARLVRAKRMAVIPGVGHAVNYSSPDRLVAAIAPFLAHREPKAARSERM
jgi:2-hydroxy-6-oxonona-2,4-dienedioate hydrolase